MPYVTPEAKIPLDFLTLQYPLQLCVHKCGRVSLQTTNYSPRSKCGRQPVCVNKVLLQHKHTQLHSVHGCLSSCDGAHLI